MNTHRCVAANPTASHVSEVDVHCAPAAALVKDAGTIRIGGGFRLPAVTPLAETGNIRIGGGFRLPSAKPAVVADKIRLGGGFRLPAARAQG
jgi:hypothetical protein